MITFNLWIVFLHFDKCQLLQPELLRHYVSGNFVKCLTWFCIIYEFDTRGLMDTWLIDFFSCTARTTMTFRVGTRLCRDLFPYFCSILLKRWHSEQTPPGPYSTNLYTQPRTFWLAEISGGFLQNSEFMWDISVWFHFPSNFTLHIM